MKCQVTERAQYYNHFTQKTLQLDTQLEWSNMF